MRTKLPKDYRKRFTYENVEQARKVIECMSEDTMTAKEALEIAMRHVLSIRGGDYLDEVLTADAETARNARVHDAFGYGTEQMDVWVHGVAKTLFGFIEVGAYLTDVYSIDGETDLTHEMYIRYASVV